MDLKIFKTLLGVDKVDKTNQSINSAVNDDNSVRKQNYKSLGFSDAGKVGGSEAALIPNLHAAKAKLQAELAADSAIQERERTRIKNEIVSLEGDKAGLEIKKEKIVNDLNLAEENIEKSKAEIANIKNNPTLIVENPTDKVGFRIGVIIILAMTLYLWLFYSSATYTAMFRVFTSHDELNFQAKVLDPDAVPNALAGSWTQALFIMCIPFVFLGLGYLIYKFGQGKGFSKYIKIGSLVAVTFVYDVLIAYVIEKKAYDFVKNGTFEIMPEYDFKIAFQSPEFWLIIFSGFVVYLIWGFVFDFVMDAHAKLNVVKVAIDNLDEKIRYKKKQCNEYKNDIEKIESEIKTKNIEIKAKENELNYVVYPVNILVDCLNSYLAGWMNFLAGVGKAKNEQEQIRLTGQNTIGEISK